MAYDEGLFSITLEADADYSAGLNQYKFVKLTTAGHQVGLVSGTGDRPVGVVQNVPKGVGHAATVGIHGVSKLQAGGAITAGDPLKVNASGQAVTSGSPGTDLVVGYALRSAAGAGEIFPALLRLK